MPHLLPLTRRSVALWPQWSRAGSPFALQQLNKDLHPDEVDGLRRFRENITALGAPKGWRLGIWENRS
jgi:hypothetical protein